MPYDRGVCPRCSVLSPSWPFLKEMSVKDLSNHLQREEKGSGGGVGAPGPARAGEPGLVPVVAVAVQQGLAVEAEGLASFLWVVVVRLPVQSHGKNAALDGCPGSLVLARAEEGLACLRHSTLRAQGQSERAPCRMRALPRTCVCSLCTPPSSQQQLEVTVTPLLLPPVFLTMAGPGQHRAHRAYVPSVRPPA